jgi:hypothetical protein
MSFSLEVSLSPPVRVYLCRHRVSFADLKVVPAPPAKRDFHSAVTHEAIRAAPARIPVFEWCRQFIERESGVPELIGIRVLRQCLLPNLAYSPGTYYQKGRRYS